MPYNLCPREANHTLPLLHSLSRLYTIMTFEFLNKPEDRRMVPLVPPELGDYIVDFLHDDPRTLRACSLTCRDWLPTARYHLYESIYLQDPRRWAAFFRLLQGTPTVGLYVQNLSLTKFISPPTTPAEKIGTSTLSQTYFPSILRHLGALKSMELSRLTLDAAFAANIAHNCSSVTALAIQYCGFPAFGDFLDLVEVFPRLERLDLLGVTWQNTTRETQTRPRGFPKLRALNLGKDVDLASIMEWLYTESLHDRIETMSVCCTSERDVTVVGYFIQALGPSLKNLEVDWSLHGSTKPSVVDELSLGNCTELESLALRFPIYFNSSAAWVTTLLSSLTSTFIRKLSMELRLLGGLDALDWKQSGKILSESQFRSLDAVWFKVLVLPGVYMGANEVKALIRDRLSAFDFKDKIRFSS